MNDTAATKKSDSLVLDTADERKLEKEVSEVELSAQSIVILTDEDFAAAGEYTRMVKATSHEYGPDDDRVYCYGLTDGWGEDIRDDCLKCPAHWRNAVPPDRGGSQ